MPETLVRPAHMWVPAHKATSGPEAADLAASAGLVLDGEQRLILDAMLAERGDGRWAAFEFAVVCCRQNGKTVALQAAALADLFLFGDKRIVWSAHEFRTAKDAFREIEALILGAPHLARRVASISHSTNDKSIELFTGQRLEFIARSKSGGRGLAGDKVILDEAFALAAEDMEALLPIILAKDNPQVRYASTAGLLTSDMLRAIRDRGRAGGDPQLGYVEFCAPPADCQSEDCDHHVGVEGCALDDQELRRAGNPTYGRRITAERLDFLRRALTPIGFARECLGWWEDPPDGAGSALVDAWALLEDHTATLGRRVLAVDVAPRGMSSSIAQCGPRPDGLPQVELVERRLGTVGLVDALVTLALPGKIPVGLDPSSEAGALILPLEEAGVTVVQVGGREMAQACSEFDQTVTAGGLRHLGDPTVTAALAGAVQKDYGDGARRWSRTTSAVDISPLVAFTIALHIRPEPEVVPWVRFR